MTEDRPQDSTPTEDPSDIDDEGGPSPRERLEAEADRAVQQFDEGIVDLLAWLLDTETRARIYIYLRQSSGRTSEEIAAGTGLYPSTVREALAELHEEGVVERHKRESEGAGNNPYEYTAIAPSELVGQIVGQVQSELNTVFNLDRHLNRESKTDASEEADPVRIEVRNTGENETEAEGEDEDESKDATTTEE